MQKINNIANNSFCLLTGMDENFPKKSSSMGQNQDKALKSNENRAELYRETKGKDSLGHALEKKEFCRLLFYMQLKLVVF